MPQISGLMKDIDSGKLSWGNEDGQRAIVQRVNSPEIISPLNTILEQEVKRGIGEVDAASGKKIADKELTHVIPTEDGRGVMYGLKVTYADGSTADSVVTEGRSTQPGDPVKVSKWGDLIKTVYERSNMYQQLSRAGQNRDTLNRVGQSLGLAQPADLKGHRQASVDLIKELNKNVAKVLSSDALGSAEEKQAQAKQLLASYEENQAKIDSIYGVSNGAAPDESSGDAPQAGGASQWANQDPVRAGILDEARRNGIPIDSVKDSAQLDALLAAYNKAKQASATAGKLRDETAKTATRTSLSQANKDSKTQRAGAYSQEYRKPLDMGAGSLSLRDLASPFSLPSNDAYVPAYARGPAK
ncbi:hypothetical protein FNBNMHLP_04111 [Aeromonas jandaei]